MRIPLLAATVLAAPLAVPLVPATAQAPADALAALPVQPSRRASALDPCGPADPLRGRLIGGSTACPLGAGEGHVSLRGAALVVIPVGAAMQASMGVGGGAIVGVTTGVNLGGDGKVMGSLRVPLLHQGGLRVAGGGHVWHTPDSRGYGYYRRSPTVVAPYVVATAEGIEGVVVTVQLSTSLLLDASRPRGLHHSQAPLHASAGLIVATGRRSRLLLEAGALSSGQDGGGVFGDSPVVVGAMLRTFGRTGAFEIGVITIPSEFDACRDSEALFCLPPVLPTLTFTRAFGRH